VRQDETKARPTSIGSRVLDPIEEPDQLA
jgi:hypothetical protein